MYSFQRRPDRSNCDPRATLNWIVCYRDGGLTHALELDCLFIPMTTTTVRQQHKNSVTRTSTEATYTAGRNICDQRHAHSVLPAAHLYHLNPLQSRCDKWRSCVAVVAGVTLGWLVPLLGWGVAIESELGKGLHDAKQSAAVTRVLGRFVM